MTEKNQKLNHIIIAYLGPQGSHSYFTLKHYLSLSGQELGITDYTLQSCQDLGAVFEAVTNKSCDYAIVPLENSLGGSVGQSFDLFIKNKIHIHTEMFSRINNCLMSQTPLAEINTVYSHPQALAQCNTWLNNHLPNVVKLSSPSTAAAAKLVVNTPGSAAIGHLFLAKQEGLNLLATNIEDDKNNWTRFVVISQEPRETVHSWDQEYKSSILFTLPDNPGALLKILTCLDLANINMRKLESRPIANNLTDKAWKYAFFVDVECDISLPQYADVLSLLRKSCSSFDLLGCYAQGLQIKTN